jgi:hypothetical protein
MPALAEAKLDLPTGMTAADRRRALEILGYGSGTKILGDPYPLGGYSGVEVGLSNEVIPTTEISNLGNKSNLQGETSYLQMSFAKGLYYNFDVLVNFAPMGQGEEVSSFGGGVRWGFFEAEYLPIALMVQVAANSTSFQNKINVSTQTLDLIASFSVEKVTLYGGVGTIRASGIFLGGVEGVTDTGSVENETLSTGRLLAGAAVKFSKFFAAIEVDRTSEPNYSGKLGIRF